MLRCTACGGGGGGGGCGLKSQTLLHDKERVCVRRTEGLTSI